MSPATNPDRSGARGRILACAVALVAFAGGCGDATASAPAPRRSAFSQKADPESVVRQAVVHGTLGDRKGLQRDLDLARMFDDALVLEEKPPSGLSDSILNLLNATAASPAEYLAAQKKLLSMTPDTGLRNTVKSRLDEEPSVQVRQLLSDANYNRFADYFNRMAKAGFMVGVYAVPAAINLAVDLVTHPDTIMGLRPEERKALFLYDSRIARDPSLQEDSESLKGKIEKIRERRLTQLRQTQEAMATLSLREQMPEQAAVHADFLETYGGDPKKVRETRDSISKLTRERGELRATSNSIRSNTETLTDPLAWQQYGRLVGAAALGDAQFMRTHCAQFESAFPKSDLSDSVRYAATAALEAQGQHEKALGKLAALADGPSETAAARHARALGDDPNYNLSAAFRQALSKHRRDRWAYLVGGKDVLLGSADHVRAQLILQGAQSGQGIGVFYSVGMLARAIRLLISNPVPNDHVIDAGVSCINRYPGSADRQKVLKSVIEEYQNARRFEKAFRYAELLRPEDPKRVQYLSAKAADVCIEKVRTQIDPKQQAALYERALMLCPEGPQARDASEALLKLRYPEEGDWFVPMEFVRGDTSLAAEARRRLGELYFDGNEKNGEISGDGVFLLRSGCARFTVTSPSAPKGQTRVQPLPSELFTRLLAVGLENKRSVETAKSPRGWQSSMSRRVFPLEFRGGLGTEGVSAYPSLKMRDYDFQDAPLFGGD